MHLQNPIEQSQLDPTCRCHRRQKVGRCRQRQHSLCGFQAAERPVPVTIGRLCRGPEESVNCLDRRPVGLWGQFRQVNLLKSRRALPIFILGSKGLRMRLHVLSLYIRGGSVGAGKDVSGVCQRAGYRTRQRLPHSFALQTCSSVGETE
jgi:hypothetical protein